MNAEPHISYLPHSAIDKAKWDDCIRQSPQGLIYAFSWYLDTMAVHWDGLVMGDYEAVMPLPWNKKWGIHYCYQPFLTAQLGVFSKETDTVQAASFLDAIPKKFRLIEFSLNAGNKAGYFESRCRNRVNYVLDLQRPYEELYNQYSDNIRRNIKKAADAGCLVEKGFDNEQVIELAKNQMKSLGEAEKGNLVRFRKLTDTQKISTTYGVFNPAGQLLSSAIFFIYNNRAYYILVGNHPDGKAVGASHALIDAFIRDHAGKKLILDFEGSDIQGLALFYKSFGAKTENYPAIKWNRLPFLLRWLKK